MFLRKIIIFFFFFCEYFKKANANHISKNIGESLDLIELRKKDSDFSVAWVDAFSQGDAVGRGYVSSASWVEENLKTSIEELEKSLTKTI